MHVVYMVRGIQMDMIRQKRNTGTDTSTGNQCNHLGWYRAS